MEKVGFIGGYDKLDLILYVAKILTKLGKKVLVMDTTTMQKARYIVPVIEPDFSYITEYEGIDVAVGYRGIDHLKDYMEIDEFSDLEYDIALIDIDDSQMLKNSRIQPDDKCYFVTAFDVYSLKKGIEALDLVEDTIKLTKVLFERDITKEEIEYLNYLAIEKKIEWDEQIIYFPIENGDSIAIAENQRISKIKFKNLSSQYKQGLIYLVNHLTGTDERTLKSLIKNME